MDINKTGKRWFYLVLGTVSLLFAGIIYAWSILKAPLAEEFGWTASQLSLNYTLTMSFFCLGCILCGLMVKKIGFKLSMIISAVLSALGFFLTGCTKGNVAVLFLSYGVLSGLGIGIAYNAVISTVGAWFPDKKGLCSGILMMGFGASALILGSLADALIATPTFGWRLTFQTLGLALGIVLLAAGLLLKRPEVEQVPATAAGSSASARDVNTAEMLRSGSFWMAFFCLSFLSAVGNTVISTAKDISLSVGTSAVLSTMLVGLLSVCNGLGRMITGALFDRAGRKTTMMIANLATIGAALITLFAVVISSPALCVAGMCLTGLSYGACPTIGSALTSEMYGTKYFSMNFPIMTCTLMLASFIATGINMLVAAVGTYVVAFLALLVLCLIALFLNVKLRKV